MINKIIEAYVEDIIDTSLKFIPNEYKPIFLLNCLQITLLHKKELEIFLANKK